MIGSGHIVEFDNLLYRYNDKRILSARKNFFVRQHKNYDGNYQVYNIKRYRYFLSSMAKVGMTRRWKDQVSASMRTDVVYQLKKFYSAYPNELCAKSKIPSKEE